MDPDLNHREVVLLGLGKLCPCTHVHIYVSCMHVYVYIYIASCMG